MKRRNVIGILVLLAVIAVIVACATAGPVISEDEELSWSVVRSPKTGNCYEVATRSAPYQGYMGMSPVSCEYLNR